MNPFHQHELIAYDPVAMVSKTVALGDNMHVLSLLAHGASTCSYMISRVVDGAIVRTWDAKTGWVDIPC